MAKHTLEFIQDHAELFLTYFEGEFKLFHYTFNMERIVRKNFETRKLEMLTTNLDERITKNPYFRIADFFAFTKIMPRMYCDVEDPNILVITLCVACFVKNF